MCGTMDSKNKHSLSCQFKTITKADMVGVCDTYSVAMKKPPHNFVSEGVVHMNSHAVSYAYLSYVCLYLKLHYPAQFMAASMTKLVEQGTQDWKDKLIDYYTEGKSMGLEFVLPSINKATNMFSTIDDSTVMVGMRVISGIGAITVERFAEERAKGEFSSILDVMERGALTAASLKLLAGLGTLDEFVENAKNVVYMFDEKPKMKYNNRLVAAKYLDIIAGFSGDENFVDTPVNRAKILLSCDEKQLEELDLLPDQVVGISQYEVNKSEYAWLYADYCSQNMKKTKFSPEPQVIGIGVPPKIGNAEKLSNQYQVVGFYITQHPVKLCEIPDETTKIIDVEPGIRDVIVVGTAARVAQRIAASSKPYVVGTFSDDTGAFKILMFASREGGLPYSSKLLFTPTDVLIITGEYRNDAFIVRKVSKLVT